MYKSILSAMVYFIPFITISQSENFHESFVEDFSDTTSADFRYGSTGNKSAFKYKLGVNSPSEEGTKILSFKIDPTDSAGAGRGPEIISRKFTHFGTYAARLKVPQVSDIQPNVGAVVGYFTYHMDSIPGLSEIDFEWLLADPYGDLYGYLVRPIRVELKELGRIIQLLAEGINLWYGSYREDHNDIRPFDDFAKSTRGPLTANCRLF